MTAPQPASTSGSETGATNENPQFDVNSSEFDIHAVLSSEDVDAVRATAAQLADLELSDDVQIEQNFKVQILLLNRVLEISESKSCAETAESRRDRVAVFHQVSKLWANLEDQPKAISQLHRALKVFDDGERNETVADTLQFLGDAYLDSGDYEEAIGHHSRAVAMLESLDGRPDECLAAAHQQLAAVYDAMGDYGKAVDELVLAQERLPAELLDGGDGGGEDYFRGDPTRDAQMRALESVMCELASLRYKMGDYAESFEAFKGAVRILEQLRGKDDAKTKEYSYMMEMASTLAE